MEAPFQCMRCSLGKTPNYYVMKSHHPGLKMVHVTKCVQSSKCHQMPVGHLAASAADHIVIWLLPPPPSPRECISNKRNERNVPESQRYEGGKEGTGEERISFRGT